MGPDNLSVGLRKVRVIKVTDLKLNRNESHPKIEQAAFLITFPSLEVYKPDDTCGLGISKG